MNNHLQTSQIDRLEDYLQDVLIILDESLHLACSNSPIFYRVVALELRILLCDSTRRHNEIMDLALLPVLRPDLKLPVLSDKKESPMLVSLEDWLKSVPDPQYLPAWTMRRIIRWTCDHDGGAHVDPQKESKPLRFVRTKWVLWAGQIVLEAVKNIAEE